MNRSPNTRLQYQSIYMDNAGAQNQGDDILERQKRILEATKAELISTRAKLKEALQEHDALFYRLFPPIRADRDTNLITSRMITLGEESTRLQEAISDQEVALHSLAPTNLSHDSSTLSDQGRSNLARLKKDLLETQSKLEHLQTLLSPIRLLPAEILEEIFSLCFETPEMDSTISRTSGPFQLSHVCSAWRTIAINKADLWSIILITLENDRDHDGWPCLVKLWVDRSRKTPLTVSIKTNYVISDTSGPPATFFRVLDSLTPYIQRWKEAEFHNHSANASANQWLRMVPTDADFSLLETFNINAHMEGNEAERLMQMLCRAPRLHSINWIIRVYHIRPIFPWAQLTHLSVITPFSVDDILDILSRSPLLVSFDVTVQTDDNSDVHDAVIHRNLQSFFITHIGPVCTLLDKVTFPSLKNLTVDGLTPFPSWINMSFMAFLQRSNCHLEKLTLLQVQPLLDTSVLDILRKLSPSLVALDMQSTANHSISDHVLQALTYPGVQSYSNMDVDDDTQAWTEGQQPEEILCPNLRELRLSGCINSSDGVLALMVESRLSPPSISPPLAALKTGVFVTHCYSQNPEDQARLSRLSSNTIHYYGLA